MIRHPSVIEAGSDARLSSRLLSRRSVLVLDEPSSRSAEQNAPQEWYQWLLRNGLSQASHLPVNRTGLYGQRKPGSKNGSPGSPFTRVHSLMGSA